jgi:AAA domain/Helix-turn-helix domain of resolvase
MSSNGAIALPPGQRSLTLDIHSASNDELDMLATQVDRKQIAAVDYTDFLGRKFAPREVLLAPWLPRAGIAMIHAPRGVGKTHVALGTAWAVAAGGGFLRWTTPGSAFRVLLLDGEMPAVVLQERLQRVVSASGLEPPLPEYLRIAAADLRRDGLPDLADPQSQGFYSDIIADADLIVVDNLSTLCRALRENEADTWAPVQAWCLAQRRQNKSVLLIHHAGKSGGQRGTSKKEDVLDTVVGLRRPPDYQADQGARFEVHFEKARGFFGHDAEPFEVRLMGDQWQESAIKSGDDIDTLSALKASGMSIREISDRTGVPRTTVHRKLEARE